MGIFPIGFTYLILSVILFYGFLCTLLFSWELASVPKESIEKFGSAGVKLIPVDVGFLSKARILAERFTLLLLELMLLEIFSSGQLPFPIDCLYTDPDCKAYDVLGLYYGIGRTFFNPASAKLFSKFETLRNAVKNYTIEATPDDRIGVLQQGGMFVFRGKELPYARKDEGTGDHAPLTSLTSAAKSSFHDYFFTPVSTSLLLSLFAVTQ